MLYKYPHSRVLLLLNVLRTASKSTAVLDQACPCALRVASTGNKAPYHAKYKGVSIESPINQAISQQPDPTIVQLRRLVVHESDAAVTHDAVTPSTLLHSPDENDWSLLTANTGEPLTLLPAIKSATLGGGAAPWDDVQTKPSLTAATARQVVMVNPCRMHSMSLRCAALQSSSLRV